MPGNAKSPGSLAATELWGTTCCLLSIAHPCYCLVTHHPRLQVFSGLLAWLLPWDKARAELETTDLMVAGSSALLGAAVSSQYVFPPCYGRSSHALGSQPAQQPPQDFRPFQAITCAGSTEGPQEIQVETLNPLKSRQWELFQKEGQ